MNENDQPLMNEVPEPEQFSAPTPSNEQVFDSTQFTGIKEDDLDKPRKPLIFTKWQFWAVVSGVIAIAAVVAIVIVINSVNENNALLISRYDAASLEIGKVMESMDKAYDKIAREAYGLGENSAINNDTIYPSESELLESKYACLGRFNVSIDDVDYLGDRKTGQELLDSGADLKNETDRLTSLSASYHSAVDAIELCSSDVLNVIAKQFQIDYGELKLTRNAEISSYMDFSQPVSITYSGDKEILSVSLVFGLYDKNDIKNKNERTIFIQNLSNGMTVDKDLYRNAYVYRTLEKASESEAKLQPKLIQIRGLYNQ